MRSIKSRGAFTLIEIMIVIAIIGLLAVVALPNFMRARMNAQKNSCIANLRLVDSTVQQWALEMKMSSTGTYTLADAGLLGYFKGSALPACPGSGAYQPGSSVAIPPTCSLSALGHTL